MMGRLAALVANIALQSGFYFYLRTHEPGSLHELNSRTVPVWAMVDLIFLGVIVYSVKPKGK